MSQSTNSRQTDWEQLSQPWDILIVGGGITGAAIFREAARLGLRVLLVEQRDFAWGTSSRSSKFVHGGLRYLKEGQLGLTRDAVHEREQLLATVPGLVERIGFLLASYHGDKIGRLTYEAGLTIYDLLAAQRSHRYHNPVTFKQLAPHLSSSGLKGGFQYADAQTDDARLVFRLIREGMQTEPTRAIALNYVTAVTLQRDTDGRVCGATLQEQQTGQTAVVQARVTINATGFWADKLRQQLGQAERLRPLRGSHLVFPAWRLPVAQSVTFLHPLDQRPVMVFPWEGVTLVGTTDVDHAQAWQDEPRISADEVAYLMTAVHAQFPSLHMTLDDVLCTYAGVRAVLDSGKAQPSEESREHLVWFEQGMLTVTGGKLTTFRRIAHDALKQVRPYLLPCPAIDETAPALAATPTAVPDTLSIEPSLWRRLAGRYGADAVHLLQTAQAGELTAVGSSRFTWAELRWAARTEAVLHLEDLLLRRTRLGLVLPHGGADFLPRIRGICQAELGWDDGRWQAEEAAYLAVWQTSYSLPSAESIPDWRPWLAELATQANKPKRRPWTRPVLGLLTAVWATGLIFFLVRQRRSMLK